MNWRTLKRLREAAGLSQKQTAEQLGINQSSIAQWETGRTTPRIFRLTQLAELYGCELRELLEDGEPSTGIPPSQPMRCVTGSFGPPVVPCFGTEGR